MPPAYTVRSASFGRAAALSPESPEWSVADPIVWGHAPYATQFRALRTASALAVRFDAADDHPWHTKTKRDDRLWEEEVVEIFLDPARRGFDYAEIEISPANVVCDLIVRRPWPNLDSDPAWHVAGLETHVAPWRARGAGPGGWTALAHIPWSGLQPIAPDVGMPPPSGAVWSFNVFRIKRPAGPSRPNDDVKLLAWSPTGGPSFHVPSAFGSLIFA